MWLIHEVFVVTHGTVFSHLIGLLYFLWFSECQKELIWVLSEVKYACLSFLLLPNLSHNHSSVNGMSSNCSYVFYNKVCIFNSFICFMISWVFKYFVMSAFGKMTLSKWSCCCWGESNRIKTLFTQVSRLKWYENVFNNFRFKVTKANSL